MTRAIQTIAKAMRDAGDTIVIRMIYEGADGVRKRRFVSPYHFVDSSDRAFFALCLTSGELRRFECERCHEVAEFPAHIVEIPMPCDVLNEREPSNVRGE